MKRIVLGCCMLAAVTVRGAEGTGAEGDTGILGITAKVGTLGYGGELTLGMGPYLGVRGGYFEMNPETDVDLDEATVTGELDWQTIPILLDVFPFGGGFRLSGGLVINNNEIRLSAKPGETLELEGTDYEVQSLDGSVTFDDQGYYFGIGYGNAVGSGGHWHFSCDFGVLFHGEPVIEASATASNPAVQEALNRDLQREVAEAQEDATDYQFYPVIALGLSYRF